MKNQELKNSIKSTFPHILDQLFIYLRNSSSKRTVAAEWNITEVFLITVSKSSSDIPNLGRVMSPVMANTFLKLEGLVSFNCLNRGPSRSLSRRPWGRVSKKLENVQTWLDLKFQVRLNLNLTWLEPVEAELDLTWTWSFKSSFFQVTWKKLEFFSRICN